MVTSPFWKIPVFVCIQTWYSEHSYLPHCNNTNGLIQSGQSISGNIFHQVISTCKEAHYSNSLTEWVLNDLASSDMNSKLHMCLLPNMIADTYNLSKCLFCFLFWFFSIRGWHKLELEIKSLSETSFSCFQGRGEEWASHRWFIPLDLLALISAIHIYDCLLCFLRGI